MVPNVGDHTLLVTPMISRRALIGWTTLFHTGVDIALYAYGPGAEDFRGLMDNTQIPRVVASVVGLKLFSD